MSTRVDATRRDALGVNGALSVSQRMFVSTHYWCFYAHKLFSQQLNKLTINPLILVDDSINRQLID